MKHIIFSNYDTNLYREEAIENLSIDGNEEPSEAEIWEEISEVIQMYFEEEFYNLKKFFEDTPLLCSGAVERWDCVRQGACIFADFEEAWNFMTKDCLYYEIYDENGHLYVKCSHHDGTNLFEIRIGDNRLKKCGYNIKLKTLKSYTRLPHFAKKFYGCA